MEQEDPTLKGSNNQETLLFLSAQVQGLMLMSSIGDSANEFQGLPWEHVEIDMYIQIYDIYIFALFIYISFGGNTTKTSSQPKNNIGCEKRLFQKDISSSNCLCFRGYV